MNPMVSRRSVLLASLAVESGVRAEAQLLIAQTLPGDGYLDVLAQRLLTEAYRRLDVAVRFELAPPERSLLRANAGDYDGDVFRVAGMTERYPNLRMVPVPLAQVEFVAFSKRVDFKPRGWESLRAYSLLVQLGIKRVEDATQGMNRTVATTKESMFRMLDADRADLAVDARVQGVRELKKLGLTGIKVLEPALETVPVYHYLHKKHEALVAPLAEALQRMEQQGRSKAIRQQVAEEFGL